MTIREDLKQVVDELLKAKQELGLITVQNRSEIAEQMRRLSGHIDEIGRFAVHAQTPDRALSSIRRAQTQVSAARYTFMVVNKLIGEIRKQRALVRALEFEKQRLLDAELEEILDEAAGMAEIVSGKLAEMYLEHPEAGAKARLTPVER